MSRGFWFTKLVANTLYDHRVKYDYILNEPSIEFFFLDETF